MKSFNVPRPIQIENNEDAILIQEILTTHVDLKIPLKLLPGENNLILHSLDNYDLKPPLSDWESDLRTSFEIHQVYFQEN